MDCVKRKNQNQKFRQISHFPFHGSRLDNSTPAWTDGTQKNIARRHAAMFGLMPNEPFFTIQDSSSPPADDADRERSDEYADRERCAIIHFTTPDRAMRRSTPRDGVSKKKRGFERGWANHHRCARDASRVFERTRRSMRRVASRIRRSRSISFGSDGRTCMMLRVWCVAYASWYEASSLSPVGAFVSDTASGFELSRVVEL